MERIQVGDRVFVPIGESTIEHDLYVYERQAKAGLADVEIGEGEPPEVFARRLLGQLAGGGVVLELLGALLVPEGTPSEAWTPEMAAETARFFGSRKGEEEKQRVQTLLLDLVIHFFTSGIASLWTSRTSSSEAIAENSNGYEPTAPASIASAGGTG